VLALFLIRESFPLLLSGAAVVIYQRIDQVMIGNMIDHKAVGYFATAGKFLDLILFLPMVLTQTVTPLVIRAREKGNITEYEAKKKQMVGIVTWVSIIMATIVSLFSYWLIYYSFGEKYLAAVPVLQIMAWKTLGMALSASAGQVIIMEGIQKWAVIKNLLGCLCCILLNYFFLPVYGIVGAAWITIITTMIAGWLGNLLIPPYHHIFRLQIYAVFGGWKEFKYLKNII
jgi:O-antigen/teichoic acid export membrane protein